MPVPNEPEEQLTILKKNSFIHRSKDAVQKINLKLDALWTEEPQKNPPWKLTNLQICEDQFKTAKGNVNGNVLRNIFTSHILTHNHNKCFYTDGSRTKDGTAFAVIGPEEGYSKARKMKEPTSIFTAELTAIYYCVIATKSIVNETIVVLTDSKSSIQAIQSVYNKNPLIATIRSDMAASTSRYCLCWVPSHVGIKGNETADMIAKNHTKDTRPMANRLLQSDVKNYIKQQSKVAWKQRWADTSQLNKLRQIADGISPLPNSCCSNRRWERILARLRLGHTRLTHGQLLTNSTLPTCEECNTDERLSVKHILLECEAYRYARLRCFHRTNLTLKSILVEGDTSPAGALAKFISTVGLMNSL